MRSRRSGGGSGGRRRAAVGLALLLACGLSVPAPAATLPLLHRVDEANRLARAWLFENLQPDSLFRYHLDPATGVASAANNALRQLMASRLLAEASRSDRSLRPRHRMNLAYVMARWYRQKEDIGWIEYEGDSRLGANAMALRTLTASPFAREYDGPARALARGIGACQKADGSFNAWYIRPQVVPDEDRFLKFYSGEAILALLEYHAATGDTSALGVARRAAEFYRVEYVDRRAKTYYPACVPWITMAYARLFDLTEDRRWADAIGVLTDTLLTMQDTTRVVGRFFNPATPQFGKPHAASDGVYSEGLAWALEVARRTGDRPRAARYRRALERALEYLLDQQYREPRARWKAPPECYVGAIRTGVGNSALRLDNTQHAIDAFTKARDVLSRR